MRFARETAVTMAGDGRFETYVHEGWDVGGHANGGYLLALAGRAMSVHAGRRDPVTLTAHYLSPVAPGPASVRCETVKAGRRFATVSATLERDGRPVVRLLGAFGELDAPTDASEGFEAAPPELPPPSECASSASSEGFAPPFLREKAELRLHPRDDGFREGRPSGEARMRGWLRLLGEEAFDTKGLLFAADAFPPTIFNSGLPIAWTPTVELTVHVRGRPASGWLRGTFGTHLVTEGFVEEDGELWDARGGLLARVRQLALVPRGS